MSFLLLTLLHGATIERFVIININTLVSNTIALLYVLTQYVV